jgi:hypothetical protein
MERLRRTSDLTLKETGQFVLLEYSEEHPPIMSNFGMGSVLVNYYRKRDEKDEHIPKVCGVRSYSPSLSHVALPSARPRRAVYSGT